MHEWIRYNVGLKENQLMVSIRRFNALLDPTPHRENFRFLLKWTQHQKEGLVITPNYPELDQALAYITKRVRWGGGVVSFPFSQCVARRALKPGLDTLCVPFSRPSRAYP